MGNGSIWVHRGYRFHYGYVFCHGWICKPLNLVSANRTIDKVISTKVQNKWSLLDLCILLSSPVGHPVPCLRRQHRQWLPERENLRQQLRCLRDVLGR